MGILTDVEVVAVPTQGAPNGVLCDRNPSYYFFFFFQSAGTTYFSQSRGELLIRCSLVQLYISSQSSHAKAHVEVLPLELSTLSAGYCVTSHLLVVDASVNSES